MSIRFACPICQSELRTGTEQWSCLQCGRVYPCTLGIPSLGGATLQPTSTERELVDRLVVLYETMSIEEMSQARLATGVTSEERRQFYANYHRMLHERGPAFQRMFQR